MVKNEEIFLTHIDTLEDPREMFATVMFYADSTKTNPWACMAYVFNPAHHTIVLWHEEHIMGYLSTEIIENNQLFICHAFCKYRVVDKPRLLDDMIRKIGVKLGTVFPAALMNSTRSGRAWETWGFTLSNIVTYVREVE